MHDCLVCLECFQVSELVLHTLRNSIDHCCLGYVSMIHVKYTIYNFKAKLSGEMCSFDINMFNAYLESFSAKSHKF